MESLRLPPSPSKIKSKNSERIPHPYHRLQVHAPTIRLGGQHLMLSTTTLTSLHQGLWENASKM
ncbi:hypothetical protein K443DRAFT_686194, partial [Laccaria amethystina LaAM-08-1]